MTGADTSQGVNTPPPLTSLPRSREMRAAEDTPAEEAET